MDKLSAALVILTLALAVFATGTYLASLVLPITIASAIIAIIVFPGAILVSPKIFAWRQLPLDKLALSVFIVSLALFAVIAPKLLIQRDDGLYTGIINAYGDIAWHMANITAFAEGQSLPPGNPIFADTRLTYPFMTNFLSASLLTLSASLTVSVNLIAVVMIPVLLTLFYCLMRELTQRKSAAIIAVLLFLFGGATFGFVKVIPDWQASGQPLLEFLTHMPRLDYSGVGTDKVFHFLNPVTSLLLPQRSFLFAFPIAFTILLLLLPPTSPNRYRFLVAGLLAGTLPLFHAHTVLAIAPLIVGLFFLKPSRTWAYFVVPALVIGLPEVLYYLRGIGEGESFFRFHLGWMAGDTNLAWYWFLNTGLLLPTIIIGLFMKIPRILKVYAYVALIIFIVANLYLFAPWAWDNFKLFVYFFIFSLPLVSYLASQLLTKKHWLGLRLAVVVLLAVHMLAASLDIFKLALPTSEEWSEWDTAGIAFSQQIRQTTQAGDSILTAPIHNSPIVLSGRPRYLGYAAHVWSHGLNPWDREDAIKEFYEGRLSYTQLPETTPDYVVVGPHERYQYPNLIIQPTWQLITEHQGYQLYKL